MMKLTILIGLTFFIPISEYFHSESNTCKQGFSLYGNNHFSISVPKIESIDTDSIQQEFNYIRIPKENLPTTVLDAINNRFGGYTIQAVYQRDNTIYKIILKNQDKIETVFLNEGGIYIREDGTID